MLHRPHIHHTYPQLPDDPVPGEWIGDTAGRLIGKRGAIITATGYVGPDPNSNYWYDPELKINGRSFVYMNNHWLPIPRDDAS